MLLILLIIPFAALTVFAARRGARPGAMRLWVPCALFWLTAVPLLFVSFRLQPVGWGYGAIVNLLLVAVRVVAVAAALVCVAAFPRGAGRAWRPALAGVALYVVPAGLLLLAWYAGSHRVYVLRAVGAAGNPVAPFAVEYAYDYTPPWGVEGRRVTGTAASAADGTATVPAFGNAAELVASAPAALAPQRMTIYGTRVWRTWAVVLDRRGAPPRIEQRVIQDFDPSEPITVEFQTSGDYASAALYRRASADALANPSRFALEPALFSANFESLAALDQVGKLVLMYQANPAPNALPARGLEAVIGQIRQDVSDDQWRRWKLALTLASPRATLSTSDLNELVAAVRRFQAELGKAPGTGATTGP